MFSKNTKKVKLSTPCTWSEEVERNSQENDNTDDILLRYYGKSYSLRRPYILSREININLIVFFFENMILFPKNGLMQRSIVKNTSEYSIYIYHAPDYVILRLRLILRICITLTPSL